MKYEITSGPALEPVTLSEAKTQLRVDHNTEDEFIYSLIATARRKFEQETGRALITQTIKAYWDGWPTGRALCLPVYPAASVTSVQYVDEDGATQTWNSSNYRTDLVGMTPRIVVNPDADTPDVGDYPNSIIVTYVAGGAASSVPAEAKHAILTELTMLYERREDMRINDNTPGVRTGKWLKYNHRKSLV